MFCMLCCFEYLINQIPYIENDFDGIKLSNLGELHGYAFMNYKCSKLFVE